MYTTLIRKIKKIYSIILWKTLRMRKHFLYLAYSVMPTKDRLKSPIFIIGSGSSGTTILAEILSQHGDLYSAGEADKAWYIADKRASLLRYDIKGKFHFDETDFKQYQQVKLNRMFCHVLKKAEKKRLVEKTPHNLYRTEWIKKIFPDAKFINIIRSGKDFINSIKKRNKFEQSPLAYPG